MNYKIITPAYNEEKLIQNILESIVNQTHLPTEWIIVDDNSTDNTAKLINVFTRKYKWIKYLFKKSSFEQRSSGAKVISAFNYGYEIIKNKPFDFIVKLDADLTLPMNYFEEVTNAFIKDSSIGICGGYCIHNINNKWIREKSADYHIRGAFKAIRRECWEDIGGFKEVLGWDGLDEMSAFQRGWSSANLKVRVIHHRQTAISYNKLELAKKTGKANYANGGNLFLAMIRTLVRIPKKPYLIFAWKFFMGYLNAYLKKERKNVSAELSKFINNFHLKDY